MEDSGSTALGGAILITIFATWTLLTLDKVIERTEKVTGYKSSRRHGIIICLLGYVIAIAGFIEYFTGWPV